MNEDAKANLLLGYVKKFSHTGVFYFNLTRRECITLYVQKLDVFRQVLEQEIDEKKTAIEMMRKLSMSILKNYKPRNDENEIISFKDEEWFGSPND